MSKILYIILPLVAGTAVLWTRTENAWAMVAITALALFNLEHALPKPPKDDQEELKAEIERLKQAINIMRLR